MARTTLDIDDAVLRELKQRRRREGKPLGVIASELLAQAMATEPAERHDFVWAARSMAVTVDLEDKDAVWAALDER